MNLSSPGCARLLAIPPALAARGIALRPETEEDVPFLRRLYISTRWEELAPIVDWSGAQKLAFLESQFGFQRRHYLTYYASTDFAVLEQDGVPVGRLYIERRTDTLLVVDVALLPEWRGHGIGAELMREVMAEARASERTVTVTVEKNNRARNLYRRLGFREIADEGAHWIMEWGGGAPDRAVS